MPKKNITPGVLVVGLGNDFRSDDGVGLFVARQVEKENLNNVKVIVGVSDGTSLLDSWENKDHAILIDSVNSAEYSGFLYKFDGLSDNIPEDYFLAYSSHSFSIPLTINLGKALGQIPKKITIYGIEGKNYLPGDAINSTVKETAVKLISNIVEELKIGGEIIHA